MKTKKQNPIPAAKTAVLTLAEIKAATEAFDRGETNAYDAIDSITVAVDAYRATAETRRKAA